MQGSNPISQFSTGLNVVLWSDVRMSTWIVRLEYKYIVRINMHAFQRLHTLDTLIHLQLQIPMKNIKFIFQLMAVGEIEMEWIRRHLGHSKDVHNTYKGRC